MAFLTLGGTTYQVIDDGNVGENPTAHVIGQEDRAFDGTLRSTVRGEKREWGPFRLLDSGGDYMTEAEYQTLRAAVAGGAFLTCSGDALNGASVSCRVRITTAAYERQRPPNAARRIPTVTLVEV
jgi:hypothetical protein